MRWFLVFFEFASSKRVDYILGGGSLGLLMKLLFVVDLIAVELIKLS